MKPELKLGRKVLAWDNDKPVKATYVGAAEYLKGIQYQVVDEGETEVSEYKHVKIDLTAAPMNGDEVIGKYGGEDIPGRYVGLDRDGYHVIHNRRTGLMACDKVRHPQPSKMERIEQVLVDALEQSISVNKTELAKRIMNALETEDE